MSIVYNHIRNVSLTKKYDINPQGRPVNLQFILVIKHGTVT